jgi:hypothetical protein
MTALHGRNPPAQSAKFSERPAEIAVSASAARAQHAAGRAFHSKQGWSCHAAALCEQDERVKGGKKTYPRAPDRPYISRVSSTRGRFHEASCERDGMRRPRARFAAVHSGGPGHRPPPLREAALRWAGRGRMKAAKAAGSGRRRVFRPRPGSYGPGAQNPAVKRRKARRPASSAGVSSAEETGPTARRAAGAAFRTSASRRFTPSDLRGRRKTRPAAGRRIKSPGSGALASRLP